MGYSLEFGPPNDEISPGDELDAFVDWDDWQGSSRLLPPQLGALAEVVRKAGFGASETQERVEVKGEFEEFSFGSGGGWLSKLPRDEREAAVLWDLLVELCTRAGWVIHDPQEGALIFAPQFKLSEVATQDEIVSTAIATLERADGDVLEAVTTLRRFQDDEQTTLVALAKAMRPPFDIPVRREAATALRDAGTQAVVVASELTDALTDADSQVRALAAQALGQLGYAARSALENLRAVASQDEYGPRLAADAAVRRIEDAPAPSPPPKSSTPSVTAPGEFVDARVVFAGANLVVAKTPNGNNVTLRMADSGLEKGATVRVSIAPNGKPREVELPGPGGSHRRVSIDESEGSST